MLGIRAPGCHKMWAPTAVGQVSEVMQSDLFGGGDLRTYQLLGRLDCVTILIDINNIFLLIWPVLTTLDGKRRILKLCIPFIFSSERSRERMNAWAYRA